MNWTKTFPFHSQGTFLNVPANDAARRFAVAGIAWDGATTNRPGARFGPEAIRRASRMLCDGVHPHFDVSPVDATTDLGDLPLPNTGIEAMRAALAPLAAQAIGRHHMLWLGGDHSITLPLLRAYRQELGRPLALVHFDAHCDTWPNHFGEPTGHGTWLAEALNEGLLVPEATIQLGIRSAAERATREFVSARGGRIFTARDLRGLAGASLAPVVAEIRARMAAAGHPPAYLTFDIDGLDPAFAPGTGTPEPGGLTSGQALTLIEELAGLNWVGMDCVEVSPPFDHAELTSNAASTIVWTHLCGLVRERTP
ncbi:MAG: agmatinase [Betaproteobacteria bacterium]|nr:agmatinase [Betaproteobacteria bacterium]